MTQHVDSPTEHRVAAQIARRLLTAVVEIADSHPALAERRRAVLLTLADVVQADSGFWAWGRGWPDSSTVFPVAQIDFGVNDQQRAFIMTWGMDAETDRTFRQPIRAQMGKAHSATTLRADIFSTEEWEAMPYMRRQFMLGGWSSWLHSVRYSNLDTWSNFFLLRASGREEFGPQKPPSCNSC